MKRRSTFGWLDLLSGVLFIALGIWALAAPGQTMAALVILFGVGALASGISDIVLYARFRSRTGLASTGMLVGGIASALVGVLLVVNPAVGQWILNILVPVWFIVRCALRMSAFGFARRIAGGAFSVVMLCLNGLGLLLGIVMLFNSSLFTISMGVLAGIALLVMGVGNAIEAFSGMGSSETT